jgi:hypothetical protein
LLSSLGLAAAVAAASAPQPSPPAEAASVVRYPASFFTPMQPNTAMDMINRLPGFTLDTGAQVRGFSGAAGNVLIDGDRPASKDDDVGSILQRIPASQVDHIDLIRGGAPGVDMHGRTVLANVVRRRASGVSGVTSVADNVFTDGRETPAIRLEINKHGDGKRLEAGLLANMFVDDGTGDGDRIRTDPNGNVLVRSRLDARAGGFQINLTGAYETPLWGGKFRINALAHMQNYKDNEDDHLITPAGLELLRFRQDVSNGELGLHFTKPLTPKLDLETFAIQRVRRQHVPSHFLSSSEEDLFAETDTSGESILRGLLRYTQSPRLSFEAALEGDFNIQGTDSSLMVDNAPVALPAAHVTVSEKRAEAAQTVTWKPSSKLTLEAGLRTEASQISSTGDVVLSHTLIFPKPRLLATFSPDADDQLRIRVEREVGQLDFSDFIAASSLGAGNTTVLVGNPNLIPQQDWAMEAAYERHFLGMVGVFTYRHLFLEDVIDRAPIFSSSGVYDAPGNIGSGREDDLDVNLTIPFDFTGWKGAQLKAQGTYRHTRVVDPTTGLERSLTGLHRFDYQAHFTQDLPRLKSTFGIDMFNRWTQPNYRFSEIDVFKLKTWIDIFYEYKPRPDLAFHVELDNVGGRGFERLLYVYNGPRDTSGLAYVDDRREDFAPYLYFRIRKTFN